MGRESSFSSGPSGLAGVALTEPTPAASPEATDEIGEVTAGIRLITSSAKDTYLALPA